MPLATTLEAIKAILRSDPSVSEAERKRLLNILRKGLDAEVKPKPTEQPAAPVVVSYANAAARSNRSVRSIHQLCKQGLLSKCKLPGRTRAAGVLESELNALIAGSAQSGTLWRAMEEIKT
jgi:hypothetical protein